MSTKKEEIKEIAPEEIKEISSDEVAEELKDEVSDKVASDEVAGVSEAPVLKAATPALPNNMIQKHVDNFLAKIAGETPVDDNPRDSTEYWLKRIAEAGGGGGGGLSIDLLWTNPDIKTDTANSMGIKDVTVPNLTPYKFILIRTIDGDSYPFQVEDYIFMLDLANPLNTYKMNGMKASGVLARRYFEVTNSTTVHFYNAFACSTYGSTSASSSNVVPMAIYGIK